MLKRSLRIITASLSLALSTALFANPIESLFKAPHNPVAGNAKGTITVAEFFDYQCSHCASMAPTISALIKANPNVRVIFKDFPIRGEVSEFAAKAALAANKQGKYNELQHALLSMNQPLTDEIILTLAKSVGLNLAQLKKEMNSPAIKAQLAETIQLATELHVSGTPAFFIGKTDAKDKEQIHFSLGEMSQSELESAIKIAEQH